MAEWSKFDLSFDCFDFPKDDSWLCEPNKPTFDCFDFPKDDPWLCEPNKPTFDCFDFPKDDPWLCEPNKPTFEINKPTFDCFDFPKDDPWLCEPNKPTFEINKPTFDCFDFPNDDPWLCEPNKPTFEITDDIPWLDDLNLYAKSLGNTSSKKCEHTVTSKDFEQSAISELEQSTTSEDIVQSTTSKDSEQSAISEDFEQSTTTSEDFEQSTTTSEDFVQSSASKDFEQSATSKDQKQHQNEKPKVIVEKIEVDISSIEILRNGYDRGVRVKPSMNKYSLHESSKRKFGTDCQSIESEKEQYNLRKKSTMINEERPPDCKSRNSRTETGMKLKDFPMIRHNIESSLPCDLYDLSEVLFLRRVKASEIYRQILEFSNFSFKEHSSEYNERFSNLQYMNLDNIKRIADILEIPYYDEATLPLLIMSFLTFPKTRKTHPSQRHSNKMTVDSQIAMSKKRARRLRQAPSLCEGIKKSDQGPEKKI